MFFQAHIDVSQQTQSDFVWLQQCHVLPDHAGLFQVLDAAQARRRRQIDPFRHFLIAEAAILLQDRQNFTVCCIHCNRWHKSP